MVPVEMLLKNLNQSNNEDVIRLILEGDTNKFHLKCLKDLERFITNDKFEKEIVSSPTLYRSIKKIVRNSIGLFYYTICISLLMNQNVKYQKIILPDNIKLLTQQSVPKQ